MLKLPSPVPGRKRAWPLAALCVIALGVSACQLSPSNSLTPTPTTLMGSISQDETSTAEAATAEASTQVSGSQNGNSSQPIDACSLITQAEAEAVLGQTVTSITPGIDDSNTFGEMLYFCTFLGQGLAVVISVADMGTPEAARQALNDELASAQADSEVSSVTQVSGLGDQAFWSVAAHAVEYAVATDKHVFGLLLGGNIGDPAEFQAALLSLAESVAGRL
jgi:hypothetical protein